MSLLRRLLKHIRPATFAVLLVCVLAGSLVGLVAAKETPTPPAESVAYLHMQDDGEDGQDGSADFSECSECHPNVTSAWMESVHADAFHNAHFQESWENQEFQESCLDCHTTGFSPATGEYEAEGVTCVACHGEVPENHPVQPVDVAIASNSCSDCHTVTQAEFRASQHENIGLECTNCHNPHDNGLRRETETQQCLSCHGLELEGFVAHDTHIANDVSCSECHGYVRPRDMNVRIDGQHPTGHDFQAALTACVDCHEGGTEITASLPQGGGGADAQEIGGQRAELRAAQLEATLQTELLARRNETVMNIVIGSLGGLLLGGLLVWVVINRMRGGMELDGVSDDGE